MKEIQYKKKCEELFKKAKSLGVELMFEPENFDRQRLNCIWYGGNIAAIKVSETFSIELAACGDIRAFLMDKNGDEIASVKDTGNCGAFTDEMQPYLKTDNRLSKAIDNGRLELSNGNWIEYDGIIQTGAKKGEIFIDLGLSCNNILDNNILIAIEQALDSIEEIKKEILNVAKRSYGIKVGAA